MNRSLFVRATLGTLAALVLASGCASPLPVPQPDPVPSQPQPVLSVDQDSRVLDAVGAAVSAADAAKDSSLLAPRVTGPALAIRTAQIQIAAGLGKDDVLAALPTDVSPMIVPTTQTWPRTSYAVTVQPEDLSSNRLIALDQGTAREQYKLWGWVRLFPGTTMPKFALPEDGSEAVAPDDDSLVMTPADAIAQYADVLNLGAASGFAATFGDDPLRLALANDLTTNSTSLAGIQGSYSMSFAVDAAQPIHAVRTADGGAVAMGALTRTDSYNGPEGASIAASPSQSVFLAGAPVSNVLTVTYVDVVAIYIPKAGSTDPVRVVGAEQQIVGASR